jgi:hypothetical protein
LDIAELREFDLNLSQRSADFFSFETFARDVYCSRIDRVMRIELPQLAFGPGENSMIKKDKMTSDPFALSLGGAKAINSFAVAPAIPHERLRQSFSAEPRALRSRKWSLRTFRRLRVA